MKENERIYLTIWNSVRGKISGNSLGVKYHPLVGLCVTLWIHWGCH